MSKNVGRPPEGRNIKVAVLFTAEEKALLEQVAKKTGLTYSKIVLRSFSAYATHVMSRED